MSPAGPTRYECNSIPIDLVTFELASFYLSPSELASNIKPFLKQDECGNLTAFMLNPNVRCSSTQYPAYTKHPWYRRHELSLCPDQGSSIFCIYSSRCVTITISGYPRQLADYGQCCPEGLLGGEETALICSGAGFLLYKAPD